MNGINTSDSDNGNIISEIGTILYKGKLPMPVENFIKVTSKYGYRTPVYNSNGIQISGGKKHEGIDLVGNLGSRIINVEDGIVSYAGWQEGYGNCVEIKHIDESGNVFYTFYAHMRENSICVQTGQKIVTGQIIGVQGSTGNSSGDHLHFEIRLENKKTIDPTPYLFNEKK